MPADTRTFGDRPVITIQAAAGPKGKSRPEIGRFATTVDQGLFGAPCPVILSGAVHTDATSLDNTDHLRIRIS